MKTIGTGAEHGPTETLGSGRRVAVSEIMSTRIVAIRSECDLKVAVDTFLRTALRHLVVVDEDRRCLGIISSEQVLAALSTRGSRRVGDRVDGPGLRVPRDAPVRRAAELMVDELVDALPVTDDDGRVVGVVTWSDIVRLVARRDLLG
jgi:acetoin utilization protein AcuB